MISPRASASVSLLALLLLGVAPARGSDRTLSYPPARIVEETKVTDPYRWLEQKNSREVQDWVKAQDDLARAYLSSLPNREGLRARFRELLQAESLSSPKRAGALLFFSKRDESREQPRVIAKSLVDGSERVALDPNAWPEKPPRTLGDWFPSPDGRFLAFTAYPNNASEGELRVVDVKSGAENESDARPWIDTCDLSWSADSKGFYFTRVSRKLPPGADPIAEADLAYHAIGAPDDVAIFAKTGVADDYLTPIASPDGRWLFVKVSHGWSGATISVRRLSDANAPFTKVFDNAKAHAQIFSEPNHLYLLTDENAGNWELRRATVTASALTNFETIIRERTDIVIHEALAAGGKLVLLESERAAARIEVRALNGKPLIDVPLPALGSVDDLTAGPKDNEIFFEFESFTAPPAIFRASLAKGKPAPWAKTSAPINPAGANVNQITYHGRDGVSITMFLVTKSGRQPSPDTPTLLTGYGGFGIPVLPRFDPALLPLIENGWAIAIPNLRGGGEYGEAWHRAAVRANKQTTIDDFLAAANYLIRNNLTRPDRLAIQGSSNGGLTVGAALTQKPHLFRAVVCRVPVLDLLRFPLFGEGKTWISEYGDPASAEEFSALQNLSPYHHVTTGTAYPSVLLISSDSDDRVDPMHARKMTAALQAATSSSHPILLLTRKNAGHSGAGRLSARLDELVDRTAFLMNETR